ncbi:Rib/alpha-like domain-containing protein [Dolosicoccus paucivorans]
MKDGTKVQHFGIRKFSVGVASVAVAAGIFFGADTALVSAEELETTPPTTEEKSETAPNADDTAEKETPDTNAGTVEENKTDTGATENNAPSNDETKEESNEADKQPLAELHDPKVTDLVTPSGVLPKAADAVTNKNDLPSDTTYKWKENPNVNIPGPGPATVVIAYSDGSNDEKTIMLTVSGDVQKESDVYTAVAKSLTTKINTLPKAEEGVEPEDEFHPFPDNTTFEWAQGPDVTTPGDKKGTVCVNYPDGSTADVKVDVKVEDSDILADKVVPKVPEKTPVVDPAALTEEEKTAVKGKIEEANKDNFPDNTTVAVAENGDATITYSDNSTDKIAGTELVEKADKKQADLNEPEVKELTTDKGVVPEAEEAVTNKQDLPEDAKYSWKTEPEVNVAGPMEATLVVTYSDDSTDEKQVVITVKDDTEESTRQEPQVQNLTTQLNVVPEASEAVTNKDELPTDTKYAWKEAPKVDKATKTTGVALVTYPDGSTAEVTVNVTIEDNRSEAEKYEPSYANAEGKAGEALRSAEPSFTSDDGTTPENPEFSLVDGAPDGAVINNLGIITYTPTEEDAAKGTVEIPVLVTYADNSSEQVTFTINVEALADIINRDGNTDAEIPEGYDRAIFKVSSEGVEEFAPIVLDIKKGTPVSTGQIKLPELVAKEGYENPRWVVAEAMTAGAGFRAVPGEKEVSILDIINMISNGGGTQSVTEFRAVADKVEEQQVIWTGRVVVDGEIIAEKPFVGTEEEVSEKLQELANSYTVQADKYTYLGSERVEDTFIYNFDSVKDAEQQVSWTGQVVVDGEIVEEHTYEGTERDVSQKLQELAGSYVGQPDKYTNIQVERNGDTFIYKFDSVKEAEQQVSWTGQVVVDGEIVEEHTYEGTERDVSHQLQVLANTYIGQVDQYKFVDSQRVGDTFIYTFESVKDELQEVVNHSGHIVVVDKDGNITEELYDFTDSSEQNIVDLLNTYLSGLKEDGYKVYDYERAVDEETGSVSWLYKVVKEEVGETETPETPETPEVDEDEEAEVIHSGHIVAVDKDGNIVNELYDFFDSSEDNIYHALSTHLGYLEEEGYTVHNYERVVDEETGAVKWVYQVVKADTNAPQTPEHNEDKDVLHSGHIVVVDKDGNVIKELYDFFDPSEDNIYHALSTHLGYLKEEGYAVYDYERTVDEETGAVQWLYKVVKADSAETETPQKPEHHEDKDVIHSGHIVVVDKDGNVIKELYDFFDPSEDNIYHTLSTHLGYLKEEGYVVYDYERIVDEETGAVQWLYKVVKVDSAEAETPQKPEAEKPQEEKPEADKSEEEKSSKEVSVKKETSREESNLPSTGEAENFALFGTAAVSVLAGLGLVGYRRRED